MTFQQFWISSKWLNQTRFLPSIYRTLALGIAVGQTFLFSAVSYAFLAPYILVVLVGLYTLFKVLHPIRWYQRIKLGYSILILDILVCIFLVLLTGGFRSPFLLYTIAPVLTAALLNNGKLTAIIAGISVLYVFGSHLGNPFFITQLSLVELSYFLIYIIAIALAATLPFLINVNLRQRLQSESILRERQRLSHEIHDGIAQSIVGLNWQVQLVKRQLEAMGINLDEVTKLKMLTTKVQQDARESLDILRSYNGKGTILTYLDKTLRQLGQDTMIKYSLDVESKEFQIDAPVELELVRVCQEALANVKKHSKAHAIQVKLKRINNHLMISIADDGCGFDMSNIPANGHSHGLEVMRERTESVGGKFQAISSPEQGTEIQVEVPINHSVSSILWQKV
ncbi:sensor histidine kinase [Chloroflexota bacterium]